MKTMIGVIQNIIIHPQDGEYEHQVTPILARIAPDHTIRYESYVHYPSDIVYLGGVMYYNDWHRVSDTMYSGGGPGECVCRLFSAEKLSGLVVIGYEEYKQYSNRSSIDFCKFSEKVNKI